MITQDILSQSLIGLRKAETIYARVVQLSDFIFREVELEKKEEYLKSARLFSSSSCFVNLYNYFILFDNFRIFNTFFSGVLS